MFERFTNRARDVVSGALTLAQQTTASEVRPEHLLMALAEDEESLAMRVLAGLGVDKARLQEELTRSRQQNVDGLDRDDAEALAALGIDLDEVVRRIDRNLGGFGAGSGKRPKFSRGAKKVLELSLREAIRLRHNYIGTEHILLSLARCGDRVVDDTLAGCGLTRNTLNMAVEEAVRQAG